MARGYQPQGWGKFQPGRGARVCEILHERRHQKTLLELEDGSSVETTSSACGRDVGEEWEHLYTNMNAEGTEVHFIRTSDIVRLIDPETGAWLYSRANV